MKYSKLRNQKIKLWLSCLFVLCLLSACTKKEQAMDSLTEETIEQSVDSLTGETIQQSVNLLTEETIKQSVNSLTKETVEQSADSLTEEIIKQAQTAESVSVYYGYQCYSFYSEEKQVIGEVADLFRNVRLQETEEVMDEATTFTVYFSADGQENSSVNVDKNGVFYLSREQKFYKDASNSFDYNLLAGLYTESGGSLDPVCIIE